MFRFLTTPLIFIAIFFSMSYSQTPQIRYSLGMSQPSTHLFEVEVRMSDLPATEQSLDLLLPVWRTGRYLVMDFAGGVQEFSAVDANGTALQWHKSGKTTWHIETRGATSITAKYKVYANEFNRRTRGLNDKHAFVDGTSVFMYADQYRNLPLTLEVHPYADWHVTTGLDEVQDSPKGSAAFTAPNYEYFIDCPMEIGTQKDFPFTIDGTPHILSIFGEGNWNADTLIRDFTKIVQTEKAFWKTEFPYKKYLFMFECTPNSGGGTEHINSAAMGIRPFGFKNPETYRGFLGLVAHEYFHTWNVKQLRPKALKPFDFQKENLSEELWIAEGMTSYFDELMLVRAGFQTPAGYLDRTATLIANERNRPGNKIQSVAEASYDAWIKYWKGNQQGFNSESDYYERGEMVSMLLDLEIRKQSKNTHTLDDVLRAMYVRFPLSGPGYTLNDFRKVAEEVSGANMSAFFSDYVYGTKALAWEEYLDVAGLKVAPKDEKPKPWLGFTTNDAGDRLKVGRIVAGSPAYTSGLDVGDEIVAVNGYRSRTSDLNDRVNELKPGDSLVLTVFQNDQLRTITLTLGTSPNAGYRVSQVEKPTDIQKEIYESWLTTKWETVKK